MLDRRLINKWNVERMRCCCAIRIRWLTDGNRKYKIRCACVYNSHNGRMTVIHCGKTLPAALNHKVQMGDNKNGIQLDFKWTIYKVDSNFSCATTTAVHLCSLQLSLKLSTRRVVADYWSTSRPSSPLSFLVCSASNIECATSRIQCTAQFLFCRRRRFTTLWLSDYVFCLCTVCVCVYVLYNTLYHTPHAPLKFKWWAERNARLPKTEFQWKLFLMDIFRFVFFFFGFCFPEMSERKRLFKFTNQAITGD